MQRVHLEKALNNYKYRYRMLRHQMSYFALFNDCITYNVYGPISVLENWLMHFGDRKKLTPIQECDLISELISYGALENYREVTEADIISNSVFMDNYIGQKTHRALTIGKWLTAFSKAGLLTETHLPQVLNITRAGSGLYYNIALALDLRLHTRAFSIEFFYTVYNASNPRETAILYAELFACKLLEDNKHLFLPGQNHLSNISETLSWVRRNNAALVTQERLELICKHRARLSSDITNYLERYQREFAKEAVLDQFFQLFESDSVDLKPAIQRIVQRATANIAVINNSGSTHYDSVDESINESVTRLNNRYRLNRTEIASILVTMSEWLNHQAAPNIFSHIKDQYIFLQAKRHFALTNVQQYNNTMQIIRFLMLASLSMGVWPLSRAIHPDVSIARRVFHVIYRGGLNSTRRSVDTLHLLALCWKAIHDDKMRVGTLYAAQQRLVQCLFEIATNNIGTTFICAHGTFNKITESLCGVHSDVVIRFVTKEVFNLKSAVVTNLVINEFLLNLLNDKPHDVYAKRVIAYLDILLGETPDEIVDKVFPIVRQKLAEEFGTAYANELSKIAIKQADFSDKLNIRERANHVLQMTETSNFDLARFRSNV